ncbi:hypothetical protein BH09PAT2_BH09PAT2_07670 [soil metagenome]
MSYNDYDDDDDMAFDDNDPEVIEAKAAAEVAILEARSKLHPNAQATYAVLDSLSDLLLKFGCLLVVGVAAFAALIIVISLFAPQIFRYFFGS